jgi:hypothetical protein
MSVHSARWSPRAELAGQALVAGVAIVLLGASWFALHRSFYGKHVISDTGLYQLYGEATVNGAVPYRDFALEYPPAAIPVFVIPSLGTAHRSYGEYKRRFERTMLACGMIALLAMAAALSRLRAGLPRLAASLGFAALAPLALGSVVQTRFDLWPAALTAVALAALLWQRDRVGLGALGLATAAKLYAAVLLPLALVFVWRRRGPREAALAGGVFLAVMAACCLPFAVLAPDGLWASFERQFGRPLQIESLGAAAFFVAHQLAGTSLKLVGYRQSIGGSRAELVANLSTVAQGLVFTGIWIWFARGDSRDPERLVRACAAVVVAFVALGKVLSPQFLIWLVPLVPLVRGRRGVAACGVLLASLVSTQVYFPYRFDRYFKHFDEVTTWLVLERDLLLLVLLAILLVPARERPAGSPRRT